MILKTNGNNERRYIVIDPNRNRAEQITFDRIDIRKIVFDKDRGYIEAQIALAAIDSSGKIITHPDKPRVTFAYQKKDILRDWTENDLDNVQEFPTEFLINLLHKERAVSRAARSKWGMDDISSEVVDE